MNHREKFYIVNNDAEVVNKAKLCTSMCISISMFLINQTMSDVFKTCFSKNAGLWSGADI